MSLEQWALKPSELKPLTRAGKLRFVRCALRAERWVPAGATDTFAAALAHVLADRPSPSLARELNARGVSAHDAKSDEPSARCLHSATSAAREALLTLELDGPAFTRGVIGVAKLTASIPAVLAHAGRLTAPRGEDVVTRSCVAAWDALRLDVDWLATAPTASLEELRARPLWKVAPEWAGPLTPASRRGG